MPDHRATGQRGEDLAAAYLRRQGYQILARNFRGRTGEVDIVARQGDTLVIVEVKAGRGDPHFPPRVRVGPQKQRTLIRLAEEVMRKLRLSNVSIRIDVVEVLVDGARGKPRFNHLQGVVSG